MIERRLFVAGSLGLALPSWAHHGWSSFDQDRPLYLEGRATKVMWRNPHGEVELELPENPTLPADLKQRPLPRQSANVDGPALLAKAQLPARRDRKWLIELAPLTRLQAWGLEEIKLGTPVAALGFTYTGEKGDPVLRAEYLFVGGKAYGLRSSPA
ncbi:DUF6152 family protein [Variovorax paradoxus]|jgi:hypothetical protein|uniref:DUF6152 family protein n=1 Tax=Variovorax paradoxus TaxID=34073 RepID=UPI003999DF49